MGTRQKTYPLSEFTTGQVAAILGVHQQTAIRHVDEGRLGGFRLPQSRFRRIPRQALLKFLERNQIPLTRLTDWEARHDPNANPPASHEALPADPRAGS